MSHSAGGRQGGEGLASAQTDAFAQAVLGAALRVLWSFLQPAGSALLGLL